MQAGHVDPGNDVEIAANTAEIGTSNVDIICEKRKFVLFRFQRAVFISSSTGFWQGWFPFSHQIEGESDEHGGNETCLTYEIKSAYRSDLPGIYSIRAIIHCSEQGLPRLAHLRMNNDQILNKDTSMRVSRWF